MLLFFRVCVIIIFALVGIFVVLSIVVVKILLGVMLVIDVELRFVEDFYFMILWWIKNIIVFGMIFEIVRYKNVFYFD